MKKPQINFLNRLAKPGLLLAIVFVLLLSYEAYTLYYKVYNNLTTTGIDDLQVNTNIVHLDLPNYQKMLDLLDSINKYEAPDITIHSPF